MEKSLTDSIFFFSHYLTEGGAEFSSFWVFNVYWRYSSTGAQVCGSRDFAVF
jgi:hypothetical protein